MDEKKDIEYKPPYKKNIYVSIIGQLLFISVFIGAIIKSWDQLSVKHLLFFGVPMIIVICISYIQDKPAFINSVYLKLSEQTITGHNYIKRFLGEIKWNEVYKICSDSMIYDNAVIIDKNGKKLYIGPHVSKSSEECEQFLNEVIRRSVNCEVIDLRKLKKYYPGLITYEKGLEK